MSLNLFFSFIDAYLVCLSVILICYLILQVFPMLKITAFVLFVELFSRSIASKLLTLPYAELYWYSTWAFLAGVIMYFILGETKKYPHLQKVTIPISFLILLVIILEILRFFERSFTDFSLIKSVYGIGSMAVNWLIVAYLFAPIALLLVKSVRSRFSAKH